jgi:cytochrome c-type biogenesis protein CcmH/NrfG
MGLLTGLLTLPLAPVRGVMWLAERVQEQAEQELDDRELLSDRLAEIDRARAAGELTAEECAEWEDEILDELGWMTGE